MRRPATGSWRCTFLDPCTQKAPGPKFRLRSAHGPQGLLECPWSVIIPAYLVACVWSCAQHNGFLISRFVDGCGLMGRRTTTRTAQGGLPSSFAVSCNKQEEGGSSPQREWVSQLKLAVVGSGPRTAVVHGCYTVAIQMESKIAGCSTLTSRVAWCGPQ